MTIRGGAVSLHTSRNLRKISFSFLCMINFSFDIFIYTRRCFSSFNMASSIKYFSWCKLVFLWNMMNISLYLEISQEFIQD